MNANQMKEAFLIRYDAIASNQAPDYEDIEISYFLSSAEYLVAERYANRYELDEDIRKRLSNLLVTNFNITASTYTQANDIQPSKFYVVPNNVMRVIRERFISSSNKACFDNLQIKVVPVKQDDVDSNFKKNPFFTPDTSMVWRLDIYDLDNKSKLHQIVMGDDYTVKEYGFIYLKKPEGIDVDPSSSKDSILEDVLHEEVVQSAVRQAVATTKQELYQLMLNEEQLNSKVN